MTRGGYSNYEAGTAPIPDDRLTALIAMGFTPSGAGATLQANLPPAVLGDVSRIQPRATVALPYVGELPGGEWDSPSAVGVQEEVDPKYAGEQRFCAKIRGDSCWPALQQGDWCVFQGSYTPQYGMIVVAQRKGDHGATVKLLERDSAKGEPVLRALNPEHEDPTAEGWGAVAYLVAVSWVSPSGSEASYFNPHGIRAKDLLAMRAGME